MVFRANGGSSTKARENARRLAGLALDTAATVADLWIARRATGWYDPDTGLPKYRVDESGKVVKVPPEPAA